MESKSQKSDEFEEEEEEHSIDGSDHSNEDFLQNEPIEFDVVASIQQYGDESTEKDTEPSVVANQEKKLNAKSKEE